MSEGSNTEYAGIAYRDIVSLQYGAPERHQLGQDGRLALQQSLHQAQEVKVHHFRQNLHEEGCCHRKEYLINPYSLIQPELDNFGHNPLGQLLLNYFSLFKLHSRQIFMSYILYIKLY
jgi:hypothetical protein